MTQRDTCRFEHLLAEPNLTGPSSNTRGTHGACLACRLAGGHVDRHDLPRSRLKAIADRYYEQILSLEPGHELPVLCRSGHALAGPNAHVDQYNRLGCLACIQARRAVLVKAAAVKPGALELEIRRLADRLFDKQKKAPRRNLARMEQRLNAPVAQIDAARSRVLAGAASPATLSQEASPATTLAEREADELEQELRLHIPATALSTGPTASALPELARRAAINSQRPTDPSRSTRTAPTAPRKRARVSSPGDTSSETARVYMDILTRQSEHNRSSGAGTAGPAQGQAPTATAVQAPASTPQEPSLEVRAAATPIKRCTRGHELNQANLHVDKYNRHSCRACLLAQRQVAQKKLPGNTKTLKEISDRIYAASQE